MDLLAVRRFAERSGSGVALSLSNQKNKRWRDSLIYSKGAHGWKMISESTKYFFKKFEIGCPPYC